MKRVIHIVFIFQSLIFLISCTEDNNGPTSFRLSYVDESWITGTFNKDRFPVIINPDYLSVAEVDFLASHESVYVIQHEDQVYIFPQRSLSAEVINQTIGDLNFAVTFCPKTMSGIAWDRTIDGQILTFAASGLLYKDNLMPYDLETETIWSQMLLKGTRGVFAGSVPATVPMLECSWGSAAIAYPGAYVLPEVNWLKSAISAQGLDPVDADSPDVSIQNWDRVAGVLFDNSVLAIPSDLFTKEVSIHKFVHSGKEFIIVGDLKIPFVTVFYSENAVSYYPVQDSFPVIIADNKGNTYDWFGNVIEGSSAGQRLDMPAFYIASWWAWKSLFPEIQVLESSSI